jgi:hypothetical protein
MSLFEHIDNISSYIININNINDYHIETEEETRQKMYNETKELQTEGFNQNFISEIYDMPEETFKQNVIDNTLPELDKLPVPEKARFPFRTNIKDFVFDGLTPTKLVRQITERPDNFEDWLYMFRYILQYFTVKQMRIIYYLNEKMPLANDCYSEPNAWVDETLEQMYISSNDEAEDDAEDADEFVFNLEWDIEKGRYNQTKTHKLKLRLPEEVGMINDDTYDDPHAP